MLNEVQILLNNEVKVVSPRSMFRGQVGTVKKIMADGRTLEVALANRFKREERIFIDASFVSEIQEPVAMPKGEPNLGPDGNSVLPHNRL
tara:strand:+ start:661 stop:930 length:270 start_codon:yes stop_codon:yes gene_type:complete